MSCGSRSRCSTLVRRRQDLQDCRVGAEQPAAWWSQSGQAAQEGHHLLGLDALRKLQPVDDPLGVTVALIPVAHRQN